MPPVKAVATKKSTVIINSENVAVKTMITRSSKSLSSSSLKKENKPTKDVNAVFPKRKAGSPIKGNTLKRSALGNITNAIETKCVINSGKKALRKVVSTNVSRPTISTTSKISQILHTSKVSIQKSQPKPVQANPVKPLLPPLPKSRLKPPIPSVSSTKHVASEIVSHPVASTSTAEKAVTGTVSVKPPAKSPAVSKKPANAVTVASKCRVTVKPKGMVSSIPNTRRSSGRRSTIDSSDSSLYVSALSDVSDDTDEKPKPLINIDEEYKKDPHQCATYAYEIFEYLKTREEHFKIRDYMEMQPGLSPGVRAILIDWMVEIQENFELNHETLYLGVKLVDTYLSKVRVPKAKIQLVGATAMLLAAKYDERIPPSIDDFVYICNDAYDKEDILKMEFCILKVIDFQFGYPLSYRFLRRYARCAKIPMPLLTLARFILELTLMDYVTITLSDSKMAAAALYLAFKMKKEQTWDDTLIHFSGYKVKDFIDVAHILNNCLHQKPRQSLSTIRNKYSHKIFFEVAKTPLVCNEEL